MRLTRKTSPGKAVEENAQNSLAKRFSIKKSANLLRFDETIFSFNFFSFIYFSVQVLNARLNYKR